MTTLRAGSATDVGRIRSNNQDSNLVLEDSELYVLADGMGGHQGGEVASALAVEAVAANAGEPTLDSLKEAVRRANRIIFEKAGTDPELHGMGTTTCAIRVVPGPEGDEIAWVNVGDSRVYLLRDDHLIQLSQDHSLVEDLLRDGQLTEDEAAVHPQRNILTRALGIDVDVDVDGSSVIPFNGDRFLLCSDGLFNEVTEDQMTSVLRRMADPGEAAEELVRLANEGGGRDNITVVLVEVVDDDGRSEAASALVTGGGVDSTEPEPTTAMVLPDHDEIAPDAAATTGGSTAFAGRRSTLPDADDHYGAQKDDLFDDMDRARSRRITWRVFAFLGAVALVAAVVVGAIAWSAHNTYYVGFRGQQVVIYRGKPGGVLFVDPQVVDTTKLTRSKVGQADRAMLDKGVQKSSHAAALRFAGQLAQRSDATTTTTRTTTTTTTTTTTAPASATTAPPVATTVPISPFGPSATTAPATVAGP